jgi:hypothetical protein
MYKMAQWKARAGTQVAHTIPKLPIERPGLALGGIGNKWRNAKKRFAHLPWACFHMAQGWVPFRRLCPHPRHLWSNDQLRTTWIMAAPQKPEQISTDFSYNLKITIKWGVCVWPPKGLQLEVHKKKYSSMPWPLSFYRGYVHGYSNLI